jgi:peptide/nickel transport system substrate-binding protein
MRIPALLCALLLAAASARAGGAVVAIQADPGQLNPAISTAGPVHQVAGSLFSGLVALDREGVPQPGLAEGWEVSGDGLSVFFRLREGLLWHDGAPLTAEDVRFSLEVLFRHHARARAGLAPAVAEIEVLDRRNLAIRLKRPHAALLRQLDVTEAPILPRHVYGAGDLLRHPANTRPIGSGPFRLASWRRDHELVLERNPHHHAGAPRLSRLTFRIIPDATTQTHALLAGEVDMLARVAPQDVTRLAARGFVVEQHASAPGGANCVMTLAFNLDRALPGEARLRAALAAIIDRPMLLERVAFGQGRVADDVIASGIGFAHSGGRFGAPDAARAQALLAELPRGITLDLAHFPAFSRWVELLRAQSAPFGITLRPRPADPAAFAEQVFVRRDFDTALISYCQGSDPEIGLRRVVHSDSLGPVPFSNAAGLRDTLVDAAFDAGAAAPSEALRRAAYARAAERIAESNAYLFLVETDFASAWSPSFRGFAPWSADFAARAERTR